MHETCFFRVAFSPESLESVCLERVINCLRLALCYASHNNRLAEDLTRVYIISCQKSNKLKNACCSRFDGRVLIFRNFEIKEPHRETCL